MIPFLRGIQWVFIGLACGQGAFVLAHQEQALGSALIVQSEGRQYDICSPVLSWEQDGTHIIVICANPPFRAGERNNGVIER